MKILELNYKKIFHHEQRTNSELKEQLNLNILASSFRKTMTKKRKYKQAWQTRICLRKIIIISNSSIKKHQTIFIVQ